MREQESQKVKSSKRKILDAAKIEFAERGLEGARVDRIAAISGVNKAMIYYHFKNKKDLYRELIKRHINELVGSIGARVSDSHDLESLLEGIVDTYGAFFTPENRFLASIFLREMASGGGEFGEIFQQAISHQGLLGLMVNALNKGVEQGELRDLPRPQILVSFIGMNLFYFLMSPLINRIWNITDEIEFRKERKKVVIDIFLNGIKAIK